MILAFFIIFIILCAGGGTTLPGFLQIVLVSAVLSLVMALVMHKAFRYGIKDEWTVYLLSPLLAAYAAVLLLEIIKANVKVMLRIFRRGQPEGEILTFRSGIKGRFGNMLLANAITLTPGTITVHVEGDEFTVHCLESAYGKGLDSSVIYRIVRKIDQKTRRGPVGKEGRG